MKYLNKIISFCNINSVSVYEKTLSVRKAKSGFTLAELMVCLTIIAVISTILIPTLGRVRPNKSKAMFKKAYNISERVVYELVNDQELYPTTDENVGIDNVSEVSYNGELYSGNTKFCELFAEKLNTLSNTPNCSASAGFVSDGKTPTFITTDGVEWIIQLSTFDDTTQYDAGIVPTIQIDVNGTDQPNCLDGASGCVGPDRFNLFVRNDGKMKVVGPTAVEYMQELNMVK